MSLDISPIPNRFRALLTKVFGCDCREQVMHPAMKEPPRRVHSGPQQLGPNQLKWLEERFKFYGIHRKQAEAQTGVAVVQSPGAPGE